MKLTKKITALVLAVFLTTGTLPLQVLPGFGQEVACLTRGFFDVQVKAADEDIYQYTVANNETTITGTKQTVSGAVTLPSVLGGYPVTAIGDYAFDFGHSITSMVLPAGLKTIGSYAFKFCDSMTSISIPNTVTSIGSYAFYSCSKLQTATIPDSVLNMWGFTFEACSSLQQVVLGNGLKAITIETFAYCTNLTSITWPAGLTSIADSAFQGCTSLKTVTVPAGVTTIGISAFKDCSTLQSISLPANLGSINKNTFQGCTGLLNITIPDSVTSIGQNTFLGCTHLSSVTLPSNITGIQDYTFSGCSKLTNIIIPSKVAVIGYCAFEDCTSLTSLAIPPSVTDISGWAFHNCSALVNLTLNPGLKTIGKNAFYSCDTLAIVSIPSTVTLIDDEAFGFCQSLISVTIPQNTIAFGSNHNSFLLCSDLAIYCNPGSDAERYAIDEYIDHYPIVSVTIVFNAAGGTGGTTVTQTSGTKLTAPAVSRTGYTFSGWIPALPLVAPAVNATYSAGWLPNKYTITFDANGGTGGTSAKMSYGTALTPPVVKKPLYIFDSWSPAVPSTVPAADTTYTAQWRPVYTYSISGGTVVITDVDTAVAGALAIPPTLEGYPVTTIGYRAFESCTGITSVTIPDSVTFIDGRAFYGCTGLTSVTIPAAVTSLGNFAFQNCTALANITIPATLANIGGAAFANTAWINAQPDGPVYIGNVFYRYKGTMPANTTVTVNTGTLGVAGSAFSGCAGLVTVNLPETLTLIGSTAFNGCTGLTQIVIPQSVTSIGTSAFNNCTAMTYCCYPDSYGHIYANTNEIPHTLVVKITFDANGGTGGTSTAMAIGAALTAPTVTRSSFVFNGWSPSLPATVPEVNTTYTAQWVTLLSYTIYKEAVTITGLNAALNGRLTIPDMIEGFPVKYIAAAALKGKTGITGVDFPAGLLTIGEQAFRGCTGLTGSVALPSTLTTIEAAAFGSCTNLTGITIPPSVRSMGADVFAGDTALTVYVYPKSYALDYADGNRLNYKVFVTVTFSLNGGTGTLPGTQNGITGNTVSLPAQGDVSKANCHFLGWGTSASATAPITGYTMGISNATLYAVWSLIPSASVRSGASTVINTQSGTIYGLAAGLTKATFESTYAAITGNGKFQYSPDTGTIGTGTLIQVIDNVTGLPVQTFRVVVYGDVNGDGAINATDADTCVNVQNWATTWDHGTQSYLYEAGDLNGDGNIDAIDADIMTEVSNFRMTVNQATGLAAKN